MVAAAAQLRRCAGERQAARFLRTPGDRRIVAATARRFDGSSRRDARDWVSPAPTSQALRHGSHPDVFRRRAALAASAAIICLNEAACIGKCLQSLSGFAEIIVVNSGSTDGTLAIVDEFARRGFPIRLIDQPWLGYARQKQFALDQATQPWVFSIDADEWLDDDLRASLPRLMAADDAISGWKVRRSLTLYGRSRPVSRWTRPEHILRLVRRGRARFDPALIVHEGLVADEGETPIARQGLLRHERSLAAQRADEEGNRLRAAQGRAAAEAGTEAVEAQTHVQSADLFPAHLFLEPLFSVRLGGLHPRGDRRHVLADDRSHPPSVVLWAEEAMRGSAITLTFQSLRGLAPEVALAPRAVRQVGPTKEIRFRVKNARRDRARRNEPGIR